MHLGAIEFSSGHTTIWGTLSYKMYMVLYLQNKLSLSPRHNQCLQRSSLMVEFALMLWPGHCSFLHLIQVFLFSTISH